jgi:hypothetical protein
MQNIQTRFLTAWLLFLSTFAFSQVGKTSSCHPYAPFLFIPIMFASQLLDLRLSRHQPYHHEKSGQYNDLDNE